MASLNASWIHGNSVQAEREGYFLSKQRLGSGAIFHTYGQEWFHFSIPTPVIIENRHATLKKIFVFYKTDKKAKIKRISVCDGKDEIHVITSPPLWGLHGDRSNEVLEDINSWEINRVIEMKFGLGISVLVEFGDRDKLGVPSVTFVAAGADFSI